jgi:hypothetical protein
MPWWYVLMYRMNLQVHGYTIVVFHPESIRYHYLYFPLGWHGVKEFTRYIIRIK